VLERNTHHQGPRPQHVDRFVFDLTVDDGKAISEALDGKADYAWAPNGSFTAQIPALVRHSGINRSRFFVRPSSFVRMFVLKTSRPLFRDNARLRQAISYAVERSALIRQADGPHGGTPVDQFPPPIMPGYTDGHVYPLAKPNVAKARKLADGNTRSRRLVLYWNADHPDAMPQIVKQDLARIELKVEIRSFPSAPYFEKLGTPGEPFDMAFVDWLSTEPDPGAALNELFDGGLIGTPSNHNFSYFDSRARNRPLGRRTTSPARPATAPTGSSTSSSREMPRQPSPTAPTTRSPSSPPAPAAPSPTLASTSPPSA
jgi:ABC-type transport system substrate-binding protein